MKRAGGQSRQENDEEQGRSRARRLTPAETAYEDLLARARTRRDEFYNAADRLNRKIVEHRENVRTVPVPGTDAANTMLTNHAEETRLTELARTGMARYQEARAEYDRLSSPAERRAFLSRYDEPDQTMDEGSGSGTSGVPAVGGFTPYASAQLIPLANRIG